MVTGKIIRISITAMAMHFTIADPTGECDVRVMFRSSRHESMQTEQFKRIRSVHFSASLAPYSTYLQVTL